MLMMRAVCNATVQNTLSHFHVSRPILIPEAILQAGEEHPLGPNEEGCGE